MAAQGLVTESQLQKISCSFLRGLVDPRDRPLCQSTPAWTKQRRTSPRKAGRRDEFCEGRGSHSTRRARSFPKPRRSKRSGSSHLRSPGPTLLPAPERTCLTFGLNRWLKSATSPIRLDRVYPKPKAVPRRASQSKRMGTKRFYSVLRKPIFDAQSRRPYHAS